jgi:hypothetical protein
MNVFQYDQYRELLREVLLAKKAQFGRTFTFARMAEACRLRHTYLSTVLKGEGDLSSDQVFDAAQFLGLADDEYEYLRLIHEHERSVSKPRRRQLAAAIERARAQGLKTEAYVDASPLPSAATPATLEFYLDPNAQFLHMFLTVKRFLDDPDKARRMLGLDLATYAEAMQRCERAGLIRVNGRKVEILKDSVHLPANSPLYPPYRATMRQKAVDFMQTRGADRHYSFSVLYSASDDTRRKIQSRFLEFVDWAQQVTQGTEPTDVYQMNFDLLRWSEG